MSLDASSAARTVVDKAREVAAKVRPGPLQGRRSLPIQRPADEIRATWAEADVRRRVLNGLPVADASLELGEADRDWGTVATIRLELSDPVPGMAAQTLTGKAVRRLKALCETGEIPTTDFNPAARPDAGEPAP